jgi:ABC-type spermidine/putrescine transport system permease subunit II
MDRYPYELSTLSVEPVAIDYSRQLPGGCTVASAVANLIDPLGNVTSIISGNILVASPTVTVMVGPFSQRGDWLLDVTATCVGSTPAPKLTYRVVIPVAWDDAVG